MSDLVEPFRLAVPQATFDNLRERLRDTGWPERETVAGTRQGPRLQNIQALVAYWRDHYDWRRCEAILNGLAGIAPRSTDSASPSYILARPSRMRCSAETRFANPAHFNELDRGGHVAALEQPTLFTDELKRTFGGLRA